ncbi:MAG: SPOR domain-containing protein [Gammaproteobacteria bacterium]|nr:SPOR domain-containing protein [Gammaproteobacteria bacterium]
MSNPFFLTRQTANLMEDLARSLAEAGSLFLLYGEPGVGKTRLLRELRDSRLEAAHVHWIDMRGVSDGQIVQVDRSSRIEEVFASAAAGDTVIVDHFEIALKKSRHQLFVSWAEQGQERGLNLVIACASEGFNELRQLAQQYQVRIQSFELMPLENDEIDALIGFHLFPDHPIGKLDMPSTLRRRLAGTRGVIARVIEIADEDGSHIRISPVAERAAPRRDVRVVVAMLLLVTLVGGVGWYLLHRPSPMLATPSPVPATVAEAPAQPVTSTEAPAAATQESTEPPPAHDAQVDEPTVADAVVTETTETGAAAADSAMDETTADDAALAESAAIEAPSSPAAATEPGDSGQDSAAATAAASSGSALAAETPDAAGETGVQESEAGTVSDSEAVLVEAEPESAPREAAVGTSTKAKATPARDDWDARFERGLERSLDWLSAREEQTGTAQILLLTYDGFDPQGYFGYIDELVARGIEREQVRIFKTLTGGRTVYSVFYGEFATRQQAYEAIPRLPAALRELDPIARSVGGIRTEIRRLEGQN